MHNTNVINNNNLGFNPSENLNANGVDNNNFCLNPNQITSNNANYGMQDPNVKMSPSIFNNNNYALDGNIKLPPENASKNQKGGLLQTNDNNAFGLSNVNNFNFNEPQNIYVNNNFNDNNELVQQQPQQTQQPEQNQFKVKRFNFIVV